VFGHSSQPSRVYAYGARSPLENADLVGDQLDRALRYRNGLVQLELWRRAQVEAVLAPEAPWLSGLSERVAALEADLHDARAAIRRQNSRQRRRDPARAAVRTATEIRTELRSARAELRAARKAAFTDPVVQARMAALDEECRARGKVLRAESGLYWGTYLTVERALRAAGSGAPPRFRGRQAPGQIAVQLQGGASWEEILEGTGQCRVEVLPLPEGATPGGRRSKRPRAILHIRVGSEGPRNRTPVWAQVPIVLHRPPPADARIKWVMVVRRQVGTHDQWGVQFVLARESWERSDTGEARGTVAVDLGWRTMEDGSMRVAYALGDDGWSGELTIPQEQLDRWRKPDDLRSERDREFARIRTELEVWLGEVEVPEWLGEATAALPTWRSPARLAALAIRWRGERFSGDEDVYHALEAWRTKDKRLYDWEAHQRQGCLRWRDDHYRRWAASLRRRYARVLVEDTDWGKVTGRPPAETDTDFRRADRARIASPGRLRDLIEEGCDDVVRVPAADSTRLCSLCGAGPARDWDRASEIDYRCEGGHRLDQDRNAARNRLRAVPDADVEG
jgi:hypothetical protein